MLIGNNYHSVHFLKVKHAASFFHDLKEILHGRNLFLNHLRKVVGDGESTNIWTNSWIQPEDLKYIRPMLQ